jgi:hypothetical protein
MVPVRKASRDPRHPLLEHLVLALSLTMYLHNTIVSMMLLTYPSMYSEERKELVIEAVPFAFGGLHVI